MEYSVTGLRTAQKPELQYFTDGRTATVSVRRIPCDSGLSLATNGKPDGSLGPEWFAPPQRGLRSRTMRPLKC